MFPGHRDIPEVSNANAERAFTADGQEALKSGMAEGVFRDAPAISSADAYHSQPANAQEGAYVGKTGFIKNHTYVNNGFKYLTDSEARVTHVSGKLQVNPGTRNPISQHIAGRVWGKPGDEGGHLVAAQFGGPGELYNHVPQSMKVNRGVIKRIENEMAHFVQQGKPVYYTEKLGYPANPPSTLRPDRFQVEYVADGVKTVRRVKNV